MGFSDLGKRPGTCRNQAVGRVPINEHVEPAADFRSLRHFSGGKKDAGIRIRIRGLSQIDAVALAVYHQ